jgi:subtilisin family serine protease
MRALGTLLTAAAAAALTGAVIPAPAQAAEGRIVGAGAPGAIGGHYIVTLRGPARTTMSALSVGSGQVLKRGEDSFTVAMSAAQARRLAANPAVRFVEQDRILHIASTQANPTWGLDRVDQRPARLSKTYTPMDDGDTVHAYVIDTGIRITHTEFGGRASYGYDFVDDDQYASDCNGHGTHVAGTIGGAHYGVAKKVRLVAVRVLDCKGDGELSDVIDGVDWVTRHAAKPAVANMSMGGPNSPSLEAAVHDSIAAGVTYVVAAGNENTDASDGSPAGLAAAITVGATDRTDRRAYFSNFGAVLDLFAPGVNIRSSVASSDTATALYSGTSMAAPHVAGAAALVLDAYPADTPAQVRNYLVAKATTGHVADRKGSPNRLLYVPEPATAPAISTVAVTTSQGRAYAGKLSLSVARRGWWTVVGGRLPVGLVLASSGAVTGTPTTPGTGQVTVRFVDFVPNTVTRTVTFTVAKTVPVIAPTTLPAASADAAYDQQLAVSDDRAGTWSVTGGVLPDGLELTESGLLTGTPGEAGTAAFTVAFTDTWGSTATRDYTLVVDPQG